MAQAAKTVTVNHDKCYSILETQIIENFRQAVDKSIYVLSIHPWMYAQKTYMLLSSVL